MSLLRLNQRVGLHRRNQLQTLKLILDQPSQNAGEGANEVNALRLRHSIVTPPHCDAATQEGHLS